MKRFFNSIGKNRQWLLPMNILLLVAIIITFPFIAHGSAALANGEANHILTYTKNDLSWGMNTKVGDNGAAQLSLFKGGKVAPGDNGKNIIRLVNDANDKISYTAVAYEIKSTDDLPISADLTAENAAPAEKSPLPVGVADSQVVSALKGQIDGKQHLDMELTWKWDFDNGEIANAVDTAIGNSEKDENITIGIYVTVEDDNSYENGEYDPIHPGTGDRDRVLLWSIVALLSLVLLVMLIVSDPGERRKTK